uniref:Bet v I/Major latex protein domain-containing protein n=1 Tax=Picea sitchensis TaxID=3332 RepID=C0PRZ3_PICSI|nr:unknown [Picea sitchensis]
MAQSVSVEIDLKVPAQKAWDAIRDSASLFPKIMPSHFKSIEVIGDGNVGTIRRIKYGEGMKTATHESERIEALDKTNMTVTYTVIEGEVLSVFKVFKPTIKLLPGADANSCRLSWTAEFERVGNTIPPSEPIKEAATNIFKAMEGYLLATA